VIALAICGAALCGWLHSRGWRLTPLLAILIVVLGGVRIGLVPAPGPLISDATLSAEQAQAVSALRCRARARDALERGDLGALAGAELICPADERWRGGR
jgi:hypothetical protein